MLKITRLGCVVLALMALNGGGSPGGVALADGNGRGPMDRDECTYTAHGSAAARAENAKPSAGSGKLATCSKTFAKWTKSSLVVYVDAANEPGNLFGTVSFKDYVQHAFDQWACASGLGNTTTFTVQDTSTTSDDITVKWSDLGSTGILGQAATSYFRGVISHSDVTMNSNAAVAWTTGGPSLADLCETVGSSGTDSVYDLLSVLTHEVGHSLGVSHPNNRCLSNDSCYPVTMYSCTDTAEWFRRSLDTGDMTSIRALYGN